MINEAKANEEEDKKIGERISAKNSFDSYVYQIKNQVDDRSEERRVGKEC